MFRHGYWLAAQKLQGGDPTLSLEAQAFYRRLGLDEKYAQPYDGVSIYTRPDDQLGIRVILQNFFTDRFDVQTHDYPYIEVAPNTLRELPMSDFEPFVCGECGAQVEMLPAQDNFIIMRKGGEIYQSVIPSDILIPRCTYCESVYMGYATATYVAEQMGGTLP